MQKKIGRLVTQNPRKAVIATYICFINFTGLYSLQLTNIGPTGQLLGWPNALWPTNQNLGGPPMSSIGQLTNESYWAGIGNAATVISQIIGIGSVSRQPGEPRGNGVRPWTGCSAALKASAAGGAVALERIWKWEGTYQLQSIWKNCRAPPLFGSTSTIVLVGVFLTDSRPTVCSVSCLLFFSSFPHAKPFVKVGGHVPPVPYWVGAIVAENWRARDVVCLHRRLSVTGRVSEWV